MVLSTLQGGKIAMDSTLLNLLERADGCELSKLLRDFRADGASPEAIRAGLACLAEAGLLRRSEEPAPDREETIKVSKTFRVCMVSVILVN